MWVGKLERKIKLEYLRGFKVIYFGGIVLLNDFECEGDLSRAIGWDVMFK